MSYYNDNKDNFLDPKVKQYGSHMVMSNVHKPVKTKYVNIDTRFRDDLNMYNASINNNIINYNFTIPERITDAKSMEVKNIEIPLSYYNISSSLKNNFFSIDISGTMTNIIIPDGQYDIGQLTDKINTKIDISGVSFAVLPNFTININNNSENTITMNFNTDCSGNSDKYYFRAKLGWLLGFRQTSYTILGAGGSLISESIYDINGPRYLYLVIDEFSNGNQNSFVTPNANFLINKNILARISISPFIFGGHNNILVSNKYTGPLLSNIRSYTGKIDIQKLNIQLVNEYGLNINLNGLEFSFCLEIVHE